MGTDELQENSAFEVPRETHFRPDFSQVSFAKILLFLCGSLFYPLQLTLTRVRDQGPNNQVQHTKYLLILTYERSQDVFDVGPEGKNLHMELQNKIKQL